MRTSRFEWAKRAIAFWVAVMFLCSSVALAGSSSTLEFGSRGSEVLKLQKTLLALGFDPNGTDGKFGRGTENAVKAYQSSKNLEVDGRAGTLTLKAIYNDAENQSEPSSDSTGTQTTTSSETLKYGDKGSRVKELQTALTKLGYSTGGTDGQFGAATQRAVIAFQKANKLTADGLAGKRTQELLYRLASDAGGSSSGGSTSTPDRTLRKGNTGDDVKQAQQKLKEYGFYSGSLDGVYGTGTMEAMKEFQRRNGLVADGVAGPQTFAKLFSSGANGAGGDSGGSGSSSSDSSGGGSSSTTYVTLRPGDSGDAVRKLQKALAGLKYSVKADGSYGNATRDAVMEFQKQNALTADGVAGALTQSKLFSGSANGPGSSSGSSGGSSGGSTSDGDAGKADGPSKSSVKLLHWFNDIKPTIRSGQYITIFDPATKLQWTLKLYSLGRHADSEPKTLADTQTMFKAFGNTNTWTPKPVYVKLPNGVWTLASMHNTPHLSGSISDNGFDGHLCVHFLRDMDECKANDPNYGVTNQNTIRQKWKEMTGETVN